jgi:hypothetical protein
MPPPVRSSTTGNARSFGSSRAGPPLPRRHGAANTTVTLPICGRKHAAPRTASTPTRRRARWGPRLDGAEKRRSEGFVCRCSAWSPSPTPRSPLCTTFFALTADRAARKVRFRSVSPPGAKRQSSAKALLARRCEAQWPAVATDPRTSRRSPWRARCSAGSAACRARGGDIRGTA